METFSQFLSTAAGYVWGPPLLVLLFGTHIFLTLRLRFIQRYLIRAIRISFQRKKEGEGDISQFGALTTALASTIGTGNIVGVATAIAAGGPGAVLWMWLTGVFGISTKYAEALLSVKYRVKTERGQFAGGPMYVIEHGMKNKPLAVLFAVFTAVAAFGIGNMVQANAISELMHDNFDIMPLTTGLVLATLTALVILGGIRSIARVCEKLVPFMAIAYVLGCVALLALNASTIPASIVIIVRHAFTGQALVGGFIGAGVAKAMQMGIARGLFSNESGLGSAPIVAAAAQTKNAVRQALVSSTGTFWDTVVVCALTGLVIVNSGAWTSDLDGPMLTKTAFDSLPVYGPAVVTFGLLTFVFSTILGWSYYGEKAIEYLLGYRAILPYRLCWVAFVLIGSVSSLKSVWAFADIANGLMALPNLISLIVLSGVIVAETRKHLWEEPELRGNDNGVA